MTTLRRNKGPILIVLGGSVLLVAFGWIYLVTVFQIGQIEHSTGTPLIGSPWWRKFLLLRPLPIK